MHDTGLLVVGTQRSGTTLLNRILNAHANIGLLFQQSNFLRLDPQSYDLSLPDEKKRLVADARRACGVYSKRFDDNVESALIAEIAPAARVWTPGDVYRAILQKLIPKKLPRTGREVRRPCPRRPEVHRHRTGRQDRADHLRSTRHLRVGEAAHGRPVRHAGRHVERSAARHERARLSPVLQHAISGSAAVAEGRAAAAGH